MATATSDSLRSLPGRALDTTESLLAKPMSVFGNSYLKNFALVLLLLYAPAAAPAISPAYSLLLQNYAIKLIYVFVLAYLLSGSIRVSVVTSVVIVLGIFLLKKFKSEHFHNGEPHEDEKEKSSERIIPSEPVVNRLELTKSQCGVSENVDPYSVDNVNAMADHRDTLQPENLKDMKSVETNSDVDGYDKSSSSNSEF